MHFQACFVTPSYAPDFERCRLLVESRAACAPGIPHYLLIDKPDLPLFRTLQGGNTMVVDTRELLHPSLHKLPGNNGWWFGWRTPPVRGWIAQQLCKLAMSRLADHDVLINVDSDVVFIRPFDVATFFDADRLGLFEVDYRNEEIRAWSATAARMIGIAPPAEPFNYVGNMIPWWRKEVLALTEQIGREMSLPWQLALARCRSFSEYMTYGTFVRHRRGLDAARHFADGRMLVQTSWHKPTDTHEGLAELFASVPPEAVAVMVHSKDRIAPESYRGYAEQAWAKAGR